MANKPSRLYRMLQPTASLFRFGVADGTNLEDDQITSVSIQRGTGEPAGGVHPSTAEVKITGYGSVRTGLSCEVALTGYGADLLSGLTGATTAVIQPRFAGRVGQQSVDDTGKTQRTTFAAASLTALLPGVRTGHTFAQGVAVTDVIKQIMTPAAVAVPTPVNLDAPGAYGTVWTAITEPAKYSDLIGKFTEDLGIIVRDTRDGIPQILTHAYRHATATASMGTVVPLTRSQAISPAAWEQANELRPRNQRLRYIGSGGGEVSAIYGDVSDTAAEVVDLDMTHVQFLDPAQPQNEAFARRAREWTGAYSIPSITVDLLYLITSGKSYHRTQAAKLMSMQVNDPIYLSGDWPSQLQGIHYAEGVNETITADGWTLTISLAPSYEVTGQAPLPVPARTWEQATYPWADETRTWANA